MKEEEFLEQIQPIPPNDYFVYFEPFDTTVQPSYSRAYFNFINTQDVYIFRDKFDGYVFVDAKGECKSVLFCLDWLLADIEILWLD